MAKAWVPRTQWFKKGDVIDAYIKSLDASWDPAKTLRMSIIDGSVEKKLQMVIPPALLNSNGGKLNIKTICDQDKTKLPNAPADYSTWLNVKGTKELPEEIEASRIGEEATQASRVAEAAIKEAAEATSVEATSAAVKKATDAVKQATDATKRVAVMLETHEWLGVQTFDSAWSATVETRKSATSVTKAVDEKSMARQKLLAKAAGDGLDTATVSVLDEKVSSAEKASKELQNLVAKAKKELGDKTATKALAQEVIDAGDKKLDFAEPEYIWMRSREDKNKALRREMKALDGEIEIVQVKAAEFEKEAASAAEAVKKVRDTAEQKKQAEKQRQDEERKQQEAQKEKEAQKQKIEKKAEEIKEDIKKTAEQVQGSSSSGSIIGLAAGIAASVVGSLGPAYLLTKAAASLGLGAAGTATSGLGTGLVGSEVGVGVGALPGLQALETIPVAAEEVEALIQTIAEEVAQEAATGVQVAAEGPLLVRRGLLRGSAHVDKRADETRRRAVRQIAVQVVTAAVRQGVKQARAKI